MNKNNKASSSMTWIKFAILTSSIVLGMTACVNKEGALVETQKGVTTLSQQANNHSDLVKFKTIQFAHDSINNKSQKYSLTLDLEWHEDKSLVLILSRFMDLDILLHETINNEGKLNVFIKNMPADSILNAVMLMKNLEISERDNRILIAPSSNSQSHLEEYLDSKRLVNSNVIDISYQPEYEIVKNAKDKNGIFHMTEGEVTLKSTSEKVELTVKNDNPMSMTVRGLDTDKALFILAEIMDLNVIIDDSVNGKIDIIFEGKSGVEAFNEIIEQQGLAVFKYDDIYLIVNANTDQIYS